ncbi:SpoIID/LytB domain-containing protein [bacterium]|nr:SpoIID/LytB domain-containing protein [bacterium]
MASTKKQPGSSPPDHDSNATQLDAAVETAAEPTVRVRLLERYNHVDFRISGSFSIFNLAGEKIFSGIESDLLWRSKVDQSEPAKYVYSVLVDTLADEDEARQIAELLTSKGHQARVLPLGRDIRIGGTLVHHGQVWRVILGAFERESDARPMIDTLYDIDTTWTPHVLRHRITKAQGTVEVYDSEYDRSAIVKQGFRIEPDGDAEITVYSIRVGVGFHWEHTEDRTYKGALEVLIGNTGNLMAINELPLDEYLKGVIPSEMHHSYPLEALKAQAVAARSYTVSTLSTRPASDTADFPATVAFQVYSGTTRHHDITTRAVVETAGQVLKSGDLVCEAFFCANSGGHTESQEFWNPPAVPYLTGIPVVKDPKKFTYDLTNEDDVNKWIRSHPVSWSNPRGTGIDILDRNARYFRWEVSYARRELEDILKRKLGFDIGTLIAVHPIKRGVSGRIVELELLGSHRNHIIHGELNIRRALSESALYSSCFVVDMVMGDMGEPVELTLIGAGFGHGVGLDQTATGAMAADGMSYDEILKRFYTGAEIDKIW